MTTPSIYTPQYLPGLLEGAYDALMDALCAAQSARQEAADARAVLARRKMEILREHAADPKSLGSNEAARDATIAALLVEEAKDADDCERAAQAAAHELEIARLRVEHLRAQLRVLEVAAAAGGERLEGSR